MQRRAVRIIVVNIILCTLVILVFRWAHVEFVVNKNNQGHAELAYSNYDCSNGTLCFNKDRNTALIDRNGTIFRFTLNARGFRGRDYPVVRESPDIIRVGIFGDSRTFGTGVADGEDIASQVELRLKERFPEQRFEVMNFGMPGMWTATALTAYFVEGRQYDLDVAIFSFDSVRYRDMNYRLLEIHHSGLMQGLMRFSLGKWMINEWQVFMDGDTTPEGVEQFFTKPLKKLAEDTRDKHLRVAFFRWWTNPNPQSDDPFFELKKAAPPELTFAGISGGISNDDYWKSPYCIPNDGHPTAEGHRYFSKRILDGIEPLVMASSRFKAAKAPEPVAGQTP